jgi:hypothetical protein
MSTLIYCKGTSGELVVFSLSINNRSSGSEGKYTVIFSAELPQVAQRIKEFILEALPDEDVNGIDPVAEAAIVDGCIYLWEESKPVTMVPKARPTSKLSKQKQNGIGRALSPKERVYYLVTRYRVQP